MNIKTLSHKDADWPKQLSNINPSVKELFIRGVLGKGPRLGVIGTRRPTSYGRQCVESIVEPLAKAGITIVSGMAIGIDGLAHEHTLRAGGRTIAVLPSSIEKPYPRRHYELAQRISQSGALISEYGRASDPHKSNFIARNRIIAALSDVLLVIEAAEKSGTMHTVDFALQLGRDVAAIPGPIGHIYSEGTNRLLKEGAQMVTSPDDILEVFGIDANENRGDRNLSGLARMVDEHLAEQPLSASQLAQICRRSDHEILITLTELEIDNLVARQSDGMYARR